MVPLFPNRLYFYLASIEFWWIFFEDLKIFWELIENLLQHLKMELVNVVKPLTIFAKSSIVDLIGSQIFAFFRFEFWITLPSPRDDLNSLRLEKWLWLYMSSVKMKIDLVLECKNIFWLVIATQIYSVSFILLPCRPIITYFGFWFVCILLQRFSVVSEKETKMRKLHFFWWKTKICRM